MGQQKTLGLTRDEQISAFENAESLVRDDFEGDDMTYGDVVRKLADAYTGDIELEE